MCTQPGQHLGRRHGAPPAGPSRAEFERPAPGWPGSHSSYFTTRTLETDWYLDSDADGFGDSGEEVTACDAPSGYLDDSTDCDDDDAAVNPDADELCDGKDNDCDGDIDEDDATDVGTWYLDGDGDGYGDAAVSAVGCDAPSGHVSDDTDCDDTDAAIFPGSSETPYDGIDQDCDGADLTDVDGDGWDASIVGGGDCHDGDASVHPGATETADGVDQDCDGTVDEGTDACDDDGDGYTENGGDCDDAEAEVHPGAEEEANGRDADDGVYPGAEEALDGEDNDCDGLVDEGTEGFDDDGDGLTELEGDCDDRTPAVSPDRSEACTPSGLTPVDENCDGEIDEGCGDEEDGDKAPACGCSTPMGPQGSLLVLAGLGLVALRRRRGALLLVGSVLGGCGGSDIQIVVRDPESLVSRDNQWVDFGSVTVGGSEETVLSLRNIGDTDLSLTRVRVLPDEEIEIIVDPTGSTLAAIGSSAGEDFVDIGLRYSPIAAAAYEGRLIIDFASKDLSSLEVPLYGNGCALDVRFVPDLLDFGSVVGPETRTSLLVNAGAAPITLGQVSLPGSPWEVTEALAGSTLDAQQTVEISVTVQTSEEAEESLEVDVLEGAAPVLSLVANQCSESSLPDDVDGDGYTPCGGDCDDGDAAVHPGATELANDADDDCDGTIDEHTDAYDDDGDGYSEDEGDCNDADEEIFPASTADLPGVDQDCDGELEGDADGDGYTTGGGDCDDDDATIHPGATETADGVDEDCDGVVDDNTSVFDDDGDGYTEAEGDCQDADAAISPAATESANGFDDDCDGAVDEGTTSADDDGDGFSELGGDCDDTDPDVSPAAVDTDGDGVDSDCDGADD